ncbi:MAG: cobalt transporter [Lachnospiraceae bacterium]|nr:cobalt transporter [Lachnospiraceae bacterium]
MREKINNHRNSYPYHYRCGREQPVITKLQLQRERGTSMHLVQDENGNAVPHSHENGEHTHTHTHTYEHSHPHTHEHGHEDEHNHSHDHGEEHCHVHEGEHAHCGACEAHAQEAPEGDKMVALLDYMLKHNEHHAAELDQVAGKFREEGKEAAAEQIKKAVDEFQKGNLYLKLALSMVQEG